MTTKAVLEQQLTELANKYKALSHQIHWYQREREETQRWFEESLRLLAPHLVPNPHTHSIDLAGNDPMERMLIEISQRLSRQYDALGHHVYRPLSDRY